LKLGENAEVEVFGIPPAAKGEIGGCDLVGSDGDLRLSAETCPRSGHFEMECGAGGLLAVWQGRAFDGDGVPVRLDSDCGKGDREALIPCGVKRFNHGKVKAGFGLGVVTLARHFRQLLGAVEFSRLLRN
jgi:hypothetical protein